VTAPLALDAALAVLLVGAALAAVTVRDLFAAIVIFIVYGLFVAIAWTRLGAVDVALAEAAIGAGLTGVLLVRAAGRIRDGSAKSTRGGAIAKAVPALACAAITAILVLVVLDPGAVGVGLTENVAGALGETGLGNPVTGVLLVFRGYDTLLETLVLTAALAAVWSLSPDDLWGGQPGVREHTRRDGVLASFGRLLLPIGLMVGIYLFWIGADAPGGAFQAGTIIAAVWLLAIMAAVTAPPTVADARLRAIVIVGPLVFLVAAAAGLATGEFLSYPPGYAKATILAVEAALTASIAATLALLVMGPPGRAP
jgi:multisubunit Na+/H+ antiporter MnhB subunit